MQIPHSILTENKKIVIEILSINYLHITIAYQFANVYLTIALLLHYMPYQPLQNEYYEA